MSLIKKMAMEIDYEEWAENYLDFISMIHDRQKAKKEKSYDYQKFLDLKKLFGE